MTNQGANSSIEMLMILLKSEFLYLSRPEYPQGARTAWLGCRHSLEAKIQGDGRLKVPFAASLLMCDLLFFADVIGELVITLPSPFTSGRFDICRADHVKIHGQIHRH